MFDTNKVIESYSTDTSYTITESGNYSLVVLRTSLANPGYSIKHNSEVLASYTATQQVQAAGIKYDVIEIECSVGDVISFEDFSCDPNNIHNLMTYVLLVK